MPSSGEADGALKVLVALGGNAILGRGERGSAQEQLANVRRSCIELARLVEEGHRVAITHGNGPQVGDILLKNELAKAALPAMPLDVCGAESEGMIGYMMQQSLGNELKAAGLGSQVVTLLTQTVVDARDPAFEHPSKPVGPFYTETEASRLRREEGWTLLNDSGRGFRRVVPSPNPVSIVEGPLIKRLFDEGTVVISAGGGGIPVIRDEEGLHGAEAVIDKDLSAALLASSLGAEVMLILTDVEKVALDFGKPEERPLDSLTVDECRRYLEQGQFPAGSMGPKIEAATRFVSGGGRSAVITSLGRAKGALSGEDGTVVTATR